LAGLAPLPGFFIVIISNFYFSKLCFKFIFKKVISNLFQNLISKIGMSLCIDDFGLDFRKLRGQHSVAGEESWGVAPPGLALFSQLTHRFAMG